MDYEKKYKEALERARDYKNNIVHRELTVGENIMDYIFPELVGSKDGQIREIITLRLEECVHSDIIRDYEKDKALAWLEKQGEVESDNDDIEVEEKGIREAFNKIEDEKQCKQKPQRMISAEAKEAMYNKPAWSEEDDAMLDTIEGWLDTLCEYLKDSRCEYIPNVKYCIDRLKSLKTRYTWKPSDEQIEALDSATENCAYSEYQDCLRELIGQLKKLREE